MLNQSAECEHNGATMNGLDIVEQAGWHGPDRTNGQDEVSRMDFAPKTLSPFIAIASSGFMDI